MKKKTPGCYLIAAARPSFRRRRKSAQYRVPHDLSLINVCPAPSVWASRGLHEYGPCAK